MLVRAEMRAVSLVALILALRMFGLFVVLPALAPGARALAGGDNAALLGLAVGAYGLTQAALQAPFGRFADIVGRRAAIAVGLLIFAAGSALAAFADDIWTLIIGRLAQGAGAISAAALAFVADHTSPQRRSRAMALIGVAIGGSFALAIVVAAPLAGVFGLSGLFALGCALALAAFIPLYLLPSPPPRIVADSASPRPGFIALLSSLWRIHLGGFILHYAMAVVFFAAPLSLADSAPLASHWRVYLAAFAASLPFAAAGIMTADKPRFRVAVRVAAVMSLAAAAAVLWRGSADYQIAAAVGLWLFFIGFNILEAALPAQASRAAPDNARAAAMGVYATGQFAGAFCGGALSGVLFSLGGAPAAFAALLPLLAAWIAVLLTPSRKGGSSERKEK